MLELEIRNKINKLNKNKYKMKIKIIMLKKKIFHNKNH
jgi:hypothetical protein